MEVDGIVYADRSGRGHSGTLFELKTDEIWESCLVMEADPDGTGCSCGARMFFSDEPGPCYVIGRFYGAAPEWIPW